MQQTTAAQRQFCGIYGGFIHVLKELFARLERNSEMVIVMEAANEDEVQEQHELLEACGNLGEFIRDQLPRYGTIHSRYSRC